MQKIDGNTRLCGLIGNPVRHTLSPLIHNYLAEVMGHNLVYVPLEVSQDLGAAVRGAYALNILGMNVTVPYKSQVMEYVKEIDESAGHIGAVNTLVRIEGGYKGYNTDYLGFVKTLEQEKIDPKGRTVVILGAGGAANPIVYHCAKSGAAKVYVLNRTLERADNLCRRIADICPGANLLAMQLKDYEKLPDEQLIVIQATSFGMHPNVDDVVIEDEEFYKNISHAVDIIYNPSKTRFMKLVEKHGGSVCNGLSMLLYQGVGAYELWNGVSVDEQVCKKLEDLTAEEMGKRESG